MMIPMWKYCTTQMPKEHLESIAKVPPRLDLHWRTGRAGTGGIGENERVVGVWVQFAISTNSPWILLGRQNASLFLAFFGCIPAVSSFSGLVPLQKATRVKQIFEFEVMLGVGLVWDLRYVVLDLEILLCKCDHPPPCRQNHDNGMTYVTLFKT